MPHAAITDLLPAYLNGTLSAAEDWHIRSHLEGCPTCRQALAAWEGIATTERASLAAVRTTRDLLAGAWATIDASAPAPSPMPVTFHWWQTAQVVLRQARLLPPVVWVASLVAIALATYVAVEQPGHDASLLLAFALPLIAATGVGFVTEPEFDPLLEVARSTPIRPSLIFLSRWGLLYGFDFVLSLVGTGVLAWLSHQGVWDIATLWVGPMALLAALSALLATPFGPFAASGTALVVWIARAFSPADGGSLRLMQDPLWATNPPILLTAAVLLGLAIVVTERRERFSSAR
ncbi:MAG: zf-HC2 domain-containing protein [Ktedonobacterales bacterium]|nr:zf-HC2 domain-containing protein [Ktedonobacterales bacterium]